VFCVGKFDNGIDQRIALRIFGRAIGDGVRVAGVRSAETMGAFAHVPAVIPDPRRPAVCC